MQKKIIALAIAAAVSAPALADNANVTIYGKVFMDVESVKNDKVAAASKDNAMRVNSNASRLGVKGSEDLGGGLNAIYQYEVEMGADGVAVAGLGKSRNSGAGLEGGFGKVILGNWDSPFKVAHNKIELFDNTTVFSALNLIGRANATTSYNTRQAQMIQYWSPNFSGLQAAVMYSPATTPSTTVDKGILSMAATYDMDAIYVSGAYESRKDATTAGSTDSGMRLVGRYTLGDAWLGATFETIKINKSAVLSYSQKNLELVGQYKFGPSKLALSYAKAGSTDVAKTGATQVSLRYGFDFSKRTEFFVAYTTLKNDAATATAGSGGVYNFNADGKAFYGAGAANATAATATNPGAALTALGAGLIHSF